MARVISRKRGFRFVTHVNRDEALTVAFRTKGGPAVWSLRSPVSRGASVLAVHVNAARSFTGR